MIRRLLHHNVSHTLSVGGSQILAAGATFAGTVFLARWFHPANYGVYAFVIAALGWVSNFSELGVFSAASRLLAHTDDTAVQRELTGACAVVALVLFGAFGVLAAVIAPLINPIFHLNGGPALLLSAPLAGGLALELAVQYLCQGVRRISLVTTRNLVARPLTLLLVVVAHVMGFLTIPLSCAFYVAGSTFASIVVFWMLRPTFHDVRANFAAIRAEARRAHDGAMYIGRVAGSSLFNMDRMLVALFLTPADVGYYALAFSLVGPITLGIQSLTIVSYKTLARSTAIPRGLTIATVSWLAVSAVSGYVLITVFIDQFLPKYETVLSILVPAILTAVGLGFVALRNQFLSAHGRGRSLRRISLTFAATNLVLYLSLIPLAGLKGGAWGSLAAIVVPLVGTGIAYSRLTRAGTPRAEPDRLVIGSPASVVPVDAPLETDPF